MPEVAVDADFFELGGRSLTAVRLSYLIEEEFGVSVTVATIFDDPTVSAIALAIDAEGPVAAAEPPAEPEPQPLVAAPAPVPTPAPEPLPDREEVTELDETDRVEAPSAAALATWPRSPVRLHLDRAPLSLAQQRLWLHGLLRPEALPYLIPTQHRLRGALDADLLEAVLVDLVRRHEILRTRIVVGTDGRPMQHIDPPPPGRLLVTRADVTDIDPTQRLDAAKALASDFSTTPIDLEVDHPFRVQLVRLAADDHLLTLLFHHVAVDARGEHLLVDDFAALYGARVTGAEPPPDPELQFADFAVWQRARLRNGDHDRSLAHWHDLLGDAPKAIEVPGRLPEVRPGGGMERHRIELSATTSEALMTLAGDAGSVAVPGARRAHVGPVPSHHGEPAGHRRVAGFGAHQPGPPRHLGPVRQHGHPRHGRRSRHDLPGAAPSSPSTDGRGARARRRPVRGDPRRDPARPRHRPDAAGERHVPVHRPQREPPSRARRSRGRAHPA